MSIIERFHNPAVQVVLAIIISCLGTYFFTVIGTRTMANAIWMFIIPAGIGIMLNEGKPKQVIMACTLMVISCLSSIALMVAVWGGY